MISFVFTLLSVINFSKPYYYNSFPIYNIIKPVKLKPCKKFIIITPLQQSPIFSLSFDRHIKPHQPQLNHHKLAFFEISNTKIPIMQPPQPPSRRSKRPLPRHRQQKLQFKAKQSALPFDLLANDFQFVQEKQFTIKDLQWKVLFKDMYPYFHAYSVTTVLIILVIGSFIWKQCKDHQNQHSKYFELQYGSVSMFWQQLCTIFVYCNFLLIIGSYLQAVYKFWYFLSFFLSYSIGLLATVLKTGSLNLHQASFHIYTSTYSIYLLILVEKRMKSISLLQCYTSVKKLPVWQYLNRVIVKMKESKKQEKQNILDFTQRPLSIKGGQTEDSFSYDSFFSYSQPTQFPQYRSGYFQSNISKRSSYISSNPLAQNKLFQSNLITKPTQKAILSTTNQLQSTIMSDSLQASSRQSEVQLTKIYKCIIFSYLLYVNCSRIQFVSYLVSICVILALVQVLTNDRLKVVMFGCLAGVGILIGCWM